MSTLIASMLWKGVSPNRVAIKKFVKEGTAIGRKYSLVVNGQWADLDKVLERILTGSSGEGYELGDIIATCPGFSEEAKGILIPSGVKAYARTPRLESLGEGDKADLTIPFEEGLQEGSGGAGGEPVGKSLNDEAAFSNSPSNSAVPADSSYRLVFEPDDVELGYGLPFRSGYKWDLTTQAPNLTTYSFPNPPGFESSEGTAGTPAAHPSDLLAGLGYDPTNLSTLAVCNIWRDGAITEQQRGALFSYLNDGAGAVSTDEEKRASRGMRAYVLRILRGETHYRYFLPHVTVVRRYRSPPVIPGFFPVPGEIEAAGELGAPPPWTNAPVSMFVATDTGEDPPAGLGYTYWSTGPEVDFVGDQWQVQVGWSGFVDMDTNMYQNATVTGDNPDNPESLD